MERGSLPSPIATGSPPPPQTEPDLPTAPTEAGPQQLELAQQPRMLEFINLLLRQRRRVFGIPITVALGAALVSAFMPRTYTATTTFVPETTPSGRLPAGLAGVASQFGLALGNDATQSPQFYADLIQSRQLMERVLSTRYPLASGIPAGDSATLIEILGQGGKDSADSLYRAVKKLRRTVSTGVDRRTNVVELRVEAHDPSLAALVANRFLVYLDEFNAKTRQSQARERRRFVEDRLTEAETDLRATEDDLRQFYQRNRLWQQAPQLVFEEGRLRRQLDIRQEVYLTLRREYETARIDETNDTPVLTVIDGAVPPTRKTKPNRMLWVIVGAALGSVLSIVSAAARERTARLRRENDSAYQEFRSLLHQAAADLKSVIPPFGRRRRTARDPD